MIPSKNHRNHAGYLVLTSADEKQPFLVHVDCIHEVRGGLERGWKEQTVVEWNDLYDDMFETPVCEELFEVQQLARDARDTQTAWGWS